MDLFELVFNARDQIAWLCGCCGCAVFDGFTGDYQALYYYWDPVTVYYLPGTTGWSTNLILTITAPYWGLSSATLPTELWLPRVQTSDGNLGVRSNQFGFNINWASGRTVVVEASPSLTNSAWHPVVTNTFTSSTSYFSDPLWTNHPACFYRIRLP